MNSTRNLTTGALFAAVIFIFTYYIHVTIPGGGGGYIHLGDGILYLAASILPTPVAVASGALGATMADVFTPGAAMWAPFTLVIKALMAFCFTSRRETILCLRNVVMSFFAGIIMVAGYFVAQLVLYGDLKATIAAIPFNLAQLAGSMILYLVIGYLFDKSSVKARLKVK